MKPDQMQLSKGDVVNLFGESCNLVEDDATHLFGHCLASGKKGWVRAEAVEEHAKVERAIVSIQSDQDIVTLTEGRPKWYPIFEKTRNLHRGSDIGVFCCGPMGKQLRKACEKYSSVAPKLPAGSTPLPTHQNDHSDTVFRLHAEVF